LEGSLAGAPQQNRRQIIKSAKGDDQDDDHDDDDGDGDGDGGADDNSIIIIIMTQDKNIVRDRTLVLRILVPGLHTSLHDKINPNNRAKDEPSATSSSSSSSSSWPTDASSSLSGSAFASSFAGGIGGGDHQILSLEGVSCIPSSKGSTLWHFRCDGATYPARLVNLPWCVLISVQ
jgi:hypothetical protein